MKKGVRFKDKPRLETWEMVVLVCVVGVSRLAPSKPCM